MAQVLTLPMSHRTAWAYASRSWAACLDTVGRQECAGSSMAPRSASLCLCGLHRCLLANQPRSPNQTPKERVDEPTRVLAYRSEEHTSELQSLRHLVCR